MRISDWSSDVCSSDLRRLTISKKTATHQGQRPLKNSAGAISAIAGSPSHSLRSSNSSNSFVRRCWKYQVVFSSSVPADRKSVVSGKRVPVRVDLGGRRIIKKKRESDNSALTTTLLQVY